MSKIEKLFEKLKENSANVKFNDLKLICEHYFGKPRQSGSSHQVFKTPWEGDPRVNIQNFKGKAKPYQVKQVLKAIERLQDEK